MKISKSDYILSLKCPLALWLKKHRSDLTPEFNEGRLSQGNEIGLLSHKLYIEGKLVTHKPWEQEALAQTEKFVAEGVETIFEAVAQTQSKEYCAADILTRNEDGSWTIIEVKSSTECKEYHLLDLSFQYYVFTNAGYNIKNCYLATINNQYMRDGEIEPHKLFKFHNVTDEVITLAEKVPLNLPLTRNLKSGEEPVCKIGKCCSNFFDCQYFEPCWTDIPKYSIFNVLAWDKAEQIFYKYKTADLKELPEEVFPKGKKCKDIECYLQQKNIVDSEAIATFLNELQYPIYFLDYETINSAVPLFKGTHPYQQIPFQFSLHIQKSPDSELEHVEFLHQAKTDPREDLIKKLIDSCGETGSVIVYNQQFEKMVNRDLAEDFPKYAREILRINERMIDLLIPFRQRMLYHHTQNGSASIKKTLPAFTDMSYEDLEIGNGGDASSQYLAFMQGLIEQPEDLFKNLLVYCGQDTLAMVKLLDVLNSQV